MRGSRGFIAAALCAATFALYAFRIGGRFDNGDEAIYAQMAREMVQNRAPLTLTWQGQPHLVRPPAAVWPLALAYAAFGPSEAMLRGVCALESALAVALLFLLSARRWGTAAGVCAALVLATASRWYLYARYIESEPLLCVFVIGALLCWERRSFYGFGACLAGALMTKPYVGLLPLVAPLADLCERRPIEWPRLGRALALAALLAAPWHLYEAIRFGRTFGHAFVTENLLHRASEQLHRKQSTPLFYLAMLWEKEGPLILLAAGGLVFAALRKQWLPVVWALGVLIPMTLSASRYDYYLLPAFPALAIATALLCVHAVPRLATGLTVALAAASILVHVLPRLHPPASDDEIAPLAQMAGALGGPEAPLVVVDQYGFTARFYGQRRTIEMRTDPNFEAASFVLPGEVVRGNSLAKVTAPYPRWFAIAPKQELHSLAHLRLLAESPRYYLLTR